MSINQHYAHLASGFRIWNSIPLCFFHPSGALLPSLRARNLEAAVVLSKCIHIYEVLQDGGGTVSFPTCFLQRQSMGEDQWDPWPSMDMAVMELEINTPIT